jgi:hypothetical protein
MELRFAAAARATKDLDGRSTETERRGCCRLRKLSSSDLTTSLSP